MSLGVPRDVEVGPIRDNQDAIDKAIGYLSQHPDEAWTGGWTTTIPGAMSVLSMVKWNKKHYEYKTDVDVGPCFNNLDAGEKAQAHLSSHPGQHLAWTGAWTTKKTTSVVEILKYHA